MKRTQIAVTNSGFDYAVAISFAGEDRPYAEALAGALTNMGISVFYDDYERSLLWGKDLTTFFAEIYENRARYCVMFLSKHYVAKAYPVLERQHAIARQLRQLGEDYILPVRVDDTELPSLPATIRYEDVRKTTIAELASLLKEKLPAGSPTKRQTRATRASQLSGGRLGPVPGATARETGIVVLGRLASGDFAAVAQFVHPRQGVALSLYAYAGPDTIHFSKEQFLDALVKANDILFGYADGSGFEVRLTLRRFLKEWLKAGQLWNAPNLIVSIDHGHQRGNTRNNLPQGFPRAVIIEAYSPGTSKYPGFDWCAVRIALEEVDNAWYVVAVAADMWTI